VKYARLHLKIDTTFVPAIPLPARVTDTRRPRFYPDEWALIQKALSSLEKRKAAASKRGHTNVRGGSVSDKSKWLRFMLSSFIKIMHGTGLRVSEAIRLRVGNIRIVAEGETARDNYREQLRLTMDQFDTRLAAEEKREK
jgi:integrase